MLRLLLVGLLLLLGACASRPAATDPAVGLPPFPDPDRIPSGFTLTFPYPLGSEFTQTYGGVIAGDDVTFAPPAGDFGWATYFIANGNGRLEKFFLNYTVTSGELWFALADFEAGHWELHGPYTGTTQSQILVEEKHYTPRRDVWAAVIAAPGSEVAVHSVRPRIDHGSIAAHDVVSGLGSAGMVSLAVVGGRPAIAFRDNAANRLRCAVARVTNPQVAADWAVSTISTSGTPGGINDIGDLNGRPVVTYTVENGGDLYFAYADQAVPESGANWSVEAIDTLRDAQYEHALAVCAGSPLVGYFEPDPGDLDGDSVDGYLRAAVPLPGGPGSGWLSYRIADCGIDSCLPALADKYGSAAAAYHDGAGGIRYIESDGNLPQSEQDWTALNQVVANGLDYPLRVEVFDGRPAIFYSVPEVLYEPMIHQALALTEFPAEQGQWQNFPVLTSWGIERQFDTAVFNGKLVFAYQRYYDSNPPEYWEVGFWRYPQAISSSIGSFALQYPVLQVPDKSSFINVAVQDSAAVFAHYHPSDQGKIVFSRNVYP